MFWPLFDDLHIPIPSQIILLALVFILLIGWIVYATQFHPLAKFPGPFLASVTRLWLICDIAYGAAEKTQRRLHERYAPNEIAIADPEAIKTIYSTQSGFKKTDFYLPFRAKWARYPDAFTNLDEHQHAERRRIVSRLYSLSSVLQSEESIDTCVETFKKMFTKKAKDREVIDMAQWMQWYAFDVVGQLFFSREFGFMENASDQHGYINALDLVVPFIAVACAMPVWMRPLFLISGALIPSVSKALNALRHIKSAADLCVARREHDTNHPKEKRRDLLDGFFGIVHSEGVRRDFTLTEVRMEAYGAFIAGSDTTAAALTAIIYHLMRTPSAYEKLTAEIDEATASGLLSTPTIQYHEAIGLQYLVACCKEGMRLHPSIGLTLPRHVPDGGRIISGEWFPAGARVGINAAIVQRDRTIFGDDADDFVPERWFRKEAIKMDRMMFQFGGGSRTCIGKNISLCEIYKLVPELLRSFNVRFADPEVEWMTRNYWFNKPSRVRAVLTVRNYDKA